MKTTKYIFLLTTLILWSCQVELPVPDNQTSGDASYVLTSVVSAGENVKVRLARTEAIGESHYEYYDNKEMLWRVLMFPDTSYYYYPEDRNIMVKYQEELVSGTSDVSLITASGEVPMTYNSATLDYECDYKPAPGEKLTVKAMCRNNNASVASDGVHECSASLTVPDWQPEFEIVSARTIAKPSLMRDDLGIIEQTADSVVEFKIKIIDRSPDIHCYRIKVQGFKYLYSNSDETGSDNSLIVWCDAFFSSDPLLYDSAITGSFGPWQANTTDVFTNAGFITGDYDLTVQSRFFNKSPLHRAIKITLQPISPSLSNYLSALYRVRCFKPTYFSEPTTLSTNIDGGVGIFGAIGQTTSRMYWFPGEEDPNYPQE